MREQLPELPAGMPAGWQASCQCPRDWTGCRCARLWWMVLRACRAPLAATAVLVKACGPCRRGRRPRHWHNQARTPHRSLRGACVRVCRGCMYQLRRRESGTVRARPAAVRVCSASRRATGCAAALQLRPCARRGSCWRARSGSRGMVPGEWPRLCGQASSSSLPVAGMHCPSWAGRPLHSLATSLALVTLCNRVALPGLRLVPALACSRARRGPRPS